MKTIFRLATIIVVLFGSITTARADEGMWLPSVISHTRLNDMQNKGFKLTAEDIYSVNKASIKDAIVKLGGCTGEIISNKGLFLTNHHCGYGQIQFHSTVENDYLTNGFTAMNLEEELPTNNYTASFLKSMSDVTYKVMKGITNKTSTANAEKIKEANIKTIIAQATNKNGFEASVESMYYTNQYFLFTYEKYHDVRLVVAPPSAIGNFGSESDNWIWPRHTGDFSMFRIYADENNRPAKYSKENVPYTPDYSLKISLDGVKEGDFTFIYGYPGRTSEYLHSAAVEYIVEKSNPHKVGLRTFILDTYLENMAKDPAIRIKYANKKAGVANAWKKWQGETKGIIDLGAIENKKQFEIAFQKWAENKPEYTNIISQLETKYKELEKYAFANDYYNEAYRVLEFTKFAGKFAKISEKKLNDDRDKIITDTKLHFKNYVKEIDLKVSKEMLNRYIANVSPEFIPSILLEQKENIDCYLDGIFNSSIFPSEIKTLAVIDKTPDDAINSIIRRDAAIVLFNAFDEMYKAKIKPEYTRLNQEITALYKYYMKGMMEMNQEREFYPDANSTLRIAYGKVSSARPKDGVIYRYNSTIEGIMEKDNPNIYDYNIPQKLRDIYATKDYGRWAVHGTIPVCFIASNHTTGGNSGSPILNAKGELIGLNFDRMWESTMSDIVFSEEMCRNIAVDIRYVLFLVDKICGAGYLLDEMELVEKGIFE